VRCYGKVDIACQAIDCAEQPGGTAYPLDRIQVKTPGRSLVCARSAQKYANPAHAVQAHCSPAAHRQGMTKIISTFHLSRRPWQVGTRLKLQAVATNITLL
jgi:hypothetical protein